MTLNVIKTVSVRPATNSANDSANSFTLPLTFFDIFWIKFHPNQRVIFYKLTESSSESFHSLILPKLELSLSLVLNHYLPLTGHVTWNPQDPKPCIIVTKDDTISLSVAETDADFSFVSGNGIRPATELHPLVPELPVSDDSASVISLQITLFPNQGFCIGITSHHGIIDGKSSTMFIKSWAHICRLLVHDKAIEFPLLPDDLTPSFDRTVINIPRELESKMIQQLFIPPVSEVSPDAVRVTLELTADNIEKLREQVKKVSARSVLDHHLSTFVIAYAYSWTCVVKARGGNANRSLLFGYVADFRQRLRPQVPATYFGNCVFVGDWFQYEAREFLEQDGFVKAVEILSDSVKGLGSRRLESIFESYVEWMKSAKPVGKIGSVAGSTRLGVYGSDFGWSKPVKTEVVSIDRNEAFSMSERRDEPGGVEMGVCLKKSDMNVFLSLFKNGLID